MKRISILFIAATSLLALTSCDDYLDKVPDDRAEVNTVDKVAKLLVSAYAGNNSNLILEMSSDNARDNGSNYTPEELEQEEAYLWKDQTSTQNDAVQSVWDACYMAAAHANQALAAIDEMGNPVELNPYRGEALLCRAWAHFQLANVFCLAYNPQTADSDMGLPYSLAPETDVKPDYERGTMAELYKHISDDISQVSAYDEASQRSVRTWLNDARYRYLRYTAEGEMRYSVFSMTMGLHAQYLDYEGERVTSDNAWSYSFKVRPQVQLPADWTLATVVLYTGRETHRHYYNQSNVYWSVRAVKQFGDWAAYAFVQDIIQPDRKQVLSNDDQKMTTLTSPNTRCLIVGCSYTF